MAGELNEEKRQESREIEKALELQNELIEGMATLVESRDLNTGQHIQSVRTYVAMIIEKLREEDAYRGIITPEYEQNVGLAAMLHDIGKIFISDMLLNKPGKLTPAEFEIIKTHTVLGAEIVDELFAERLANTTVSVIRDIVLHHHEKWNGEGYPHGLKGEDIPLSARIVAVADVFDALVANRAYKDSMPIDRAFDILKKDSGTHFDKAIVDIFVGLRPQIEDYLASQKNVKDRKSVFAQFADFENKLQRESIIRGLVSDFEAVFYAEPDNDRITVIRRSDGSVFCAEAEENSTMTFGEFIDGIKPYVHPDEQKQFLAMAGKDSIRDQFGSGDAALLTFKNLYEGKNEFYEMKLMRLGKTGDRQFDILIGIHNVNEFELVKIEEKTQLMQAKEEADRANAAKSAFVYKISQEIRTPLTDVIGFTDMALSGGTDEDKRQSYMEKAQRSEKSMLQVIDRILEMEEARDTTGMVRSVAVSENEDEEYSEDALAGKKILLVEDNELNREIANEILTECGADVVCAENGQEAIHTLEEQPDGYFDVVLMDVEMPVMDGVEATRKIRAMENKALADIPIIAMTANAFEKDRKQASEAGMDAFLAKPIDVPTLLSTVRNVETKAHKAPVFNSDVLSYSILKNADIGLWAIELEDGKEPRMYADETMKKLLGASGVSTPEETYLAWYERIHPGHYEDVSKCVEEMIGGRHVEVQYPWFHPKNGLRQVRCGGVRNFSYTSGVRLEGCHQDVTEMLQVRTEEAGTEAK